MNCATFNQFRTFLETITPLPETVVFPARMPVLSARVQGANVFNKIDFQCNARYAGVPAFLQI